MVLSSCFSGREEGKEEEEKEEEIKILN